MFAWALSALLGAGLAQEPAREDSAAAPVEQASPRVRLVYTGGRGGVGSGRYAFEALRALKALSAGGEASLTGVRGSRATLAQGPWLLRTEGRAVRDVLAFLEGGGVRCGEARPALHFQDATDEVWLPADAAPLLRDGLAARLRELGDAAVRSCSNAAGAQAELLGPASGELPSFELSRFEFRLSLDIAFTHQSNETRLSLTGRPVMEASRTFAAAAALLQETPGALFVDAGNFLDGASSVADGALSLHRPLGLDMLQRLAPAALVPGANELAAGAAAFRREIAGLELPYIATNWSAKDAQSAFPRSVVRVVQTPDGPVRIAFIGILDPALPLSVPALLAEGVEITDPVEGVQPVVDALYASAEPPAAVVALSNASADVLAALRRRLRGVDVLAGDPTFATIRVVQTSVALRPLASGAKGAPFTVSLDGLATVDLRFAGDPLVLREADSRPVMVRDDQPLDPAITARITATRAETYPALDHPLLPALGAGPAEPMDQATWSALVCEAVRARTHADTVFLTDLPPVGRIPGPLSELDVVDQLSLLDSLELHRVSGASMATLLNRAYGLVPVVCGTLPGTLYPKARGRLLEPGRTYRVVTTNRTRATGPLGPVLAAVTPTGWLDGRTHEALTGPDGRPLTLRAATLDALRAARDQAGSVEGGARRLLEEAPAAVPPMWLLRVRGLSLAVDRFQSVGDDRFAEVPETYASADSSLSLASDLDVALDFSSEAVVSDLRLRAGYATLRAGEEDAVETSDDLLLSSSLALPGWSFPRSAGFQLRPYGELRLDSEITPTVSEQGPNPRQGDLSLLLGLSAANQGPLESAVLGAFVNQDLIVRDKAPEAGGRLGWSTLVLFSSSLRWSTTGEVSLFAATPSDDPSDLRLWAEGRTALAMPLARFLSVGPWAAAWLMQGRVPETATPGLAWSLGASLDLSGAFEL